MRAQQELKLIFLTEDILSNTFDKAQFHELLLFHELGIQDAGSLVTLPQFPGTQTRSIVNVVCHTCASPVETNPNACCETGHRERSSVMDD